MSSNIIVLSDYVSGKRKKIEGPEDGSNIIDMSGGLVFNIVDELSLYDENIGGIIMITTLKFKEAERLLNVLNTINGCTGQFAYFVERNKKKIMPVLKRTYDELVNRTPEEQSYVDARNSMLSKMGSVAETDEEKQYDAKKREFIMSLQDTNKSVEDREKVSSEFTKYQEDNKDISKVLDDRMKAKQEEFTKFEEDNKELLKVIEGKMKVISETDITIEFYMKPLSIFPENYTSQEYIRELDILIEE
jgi:hypothetical protein